MPKRKQTLSTYGRHRQRVVSVDLWSSSDDNKKGLFSSFSSNDSTNHDASTEQVKIPCQKKTGVLSQAFDKKSTTYGKRKGKENVPASKPLKSRKGTKLDVSNDSSGSDGIFKSTERKARKVLRDYNETEEENDEIIPKGRKRGKRQPLLTKPAPMEDTKRNIQIKKQDERPTKQDTRKSKRNKKPEVIEQQSVLGRKTRNNNKAENDEKKVESRKPVKKKVANDSVTNFSLSSIESSRHDSNSLCNFSEFEKYSLLISDTPDADPLATPEIDLAPADRNRKSLHASAKAALTSTPHMFMEDKIKRSLYQNISNDTNLSHIESSEENLQDLVFQRQTRNRAAKMRKCYEESIEEEVVAEKLRQMSVSSPDSGSESDKLKQCPVVVVSRLQIGDENQAGDDSMANQNQLNGLSRNTYLTCLSTKYDASRSLFDHSDVSQQAAMGNNVISASLAPQTRSQSNMAASLGEQMADCGSDGEDHIAVEEEEEDSVTGPSDIEELSDIIEEDDAKTSDSEDDYTCSDTLNSKAAKPVLNRNKQHLPHIQEMYTSCCDELEEAAVQQVNVKDSAYRTGTNCTCRSDMEGVTPSTYHSCHSLCSNHSPSLQVMTPHQNRVRQLQDELNESCQSMRELLTPVRLKRTGRVISAREKLLMQCDQAGPIRFTEAIPPSMMKDIVKIGEGVYGEVFRARRHGQSVALKIIPIEGSLLVNDEKQKTFEEILPEIVISKELCALRDNENFLTENFVEVKGVSLVQGTYPDTLLKQWDLYHKRKGSENDRPDMFPEDQYFLVFEFEDAGCDLEAVKLTSMLQARSILYQVTYSLAIAETAMQFEHRDLHWGNVLVRATGSEMINYSLEGNELEVEAHGVKVAVIDFTLSRLCKDGCSVYTDLSTDPTLFESQGDYQFDVYRLMKEENSNEWQSHNPFTNVLWIHYLADKLMRGKTYSDTGSKQHRILSREFRGFVREALDYSSALHLLTECPFFQE